MTEPIRVLLVDDQPLIRTGFRLILSAEPGVTVVGEAGDGAEALAWLSRHTDTSNAESSSTTAVPPCDVVLMDVRMPKLNGIDATEAITLKFPEVKVLVLTTFDLDEYALAAIRAGAAGFLLKDARPTELVDAIHRVFTGDAVMAPSMTKRMVEKMLATPDADSNDSSGVEGTGDAEARPFEALTEREFDVLKLIAEGLNNQEIGTRLFLSESTVKTHVGRIFAKLELRDRVHAVILAKQFGL